MLGLFRLAFVVGFAFVAYSRPVALGSVLVWTVVGFALALALSVAFGRGGS